MKKEIKLGSKVRNKISGFVGIAVARTEFLNGCIQYNVQPKAGKDNKVPEDIAVDVGSLEMIQPKKVKIKKKDTGGAMTRHLCRRNF
ncbi:MAG TPA: hypothetical protein ENG87_01705 [Candidatus Pacearchaeota archaeon]|nr:hypothetical protein [Candidatus Pacearchaeota archaeon]